MAASEFVGTYHRCWSFDLHIFHDKDKEEINQSLIWLAVKK